MPTLVATPWPSGPVVVSTPEVQRYSGWPGHLLSSWRKRSMPSSFTESSPKVSYLGFTAFTPVKWSIESQVRSEEHTSELQSLRHLVCRLLLEKKKKSK